MTKFKKGEIIKGTVTGIEKYGIFVNLDNYYTGLIHISEISNFFVKNINDYVKIGETIKAEVLDVNEKESHVKLSIKNIDYRFNRKRRTKIVETKTGFKTLKIKLNEWIKNKEQEIMTKSKKN